MSEPFWLNRQMIIAIHDEQLTIHGGAGGLRDEGMLESALDRPRNKWTCEQAELAELERFSIDMNRNNKGVPRGAQIRFELL
jgi:death-on-curing protein